MNTRTKGMLLSNYVADQIVAKGLDPKARADGGSGAGNREKADVSTSMRILGQNAGIECKNQARVSVRNAWKQTRKLEVLGYEPILVFKEFMEPLEQARVILYYDTFLELVKASKGVTIPQPKPADMPRELLSAITMTEIYLKKLEKLLLEYRNNQLT